ncbi:hypothetical protein D3C86_1800320 [compost metagenome]
MLHPGQVGAGAEMLAATAHDQKPKAGVTRDFVEGEDQLADHFGVEGVVLFFTAEPQRGKTTGVGQQFEGVEVAHIRPSPRSL